MTHGEEFWEAERILDEKVENGVSHFLIQWLGEDSKGDPWKPTWEPEGNCTKALIKEWKIVKGGRKVKRRSSERKISISSCDTLSDGGDVGDVGDDHDSSETSTIVDDGEYESLNDAADASNENLAPATNSTPGFLSAVANFIGISTSQKRPKADSNSDEQIDEIKKVRTKESLDDEKSNEICEKTDVSVAQQLRQVQTPTNPVQQNSLLDNKDNTVLTTSNVSMSTRNTCNSGYFHAHSNASGLINEIKSKNNMVAFLLKEKEYLQKKLKQYEKNRRFHQSRNQMLTQENIKARKLLQDKQIELTKIYSELERVLGEFEGSRKLCNKKDTKLKAMEIELEEHKKQFDAKHKKDQKQIALLKKTNNNLTIENKKLLEKTETSKTFDFSISSDLNNLGQITRSSGNIQALRAENERLTSKINNLNLQCSLQRQNMIVLEEKVMEQESLIRLLMDIQKISQHGDQRVEDLKRKVSMSINPPLSNTLPVNMMPPIGAPFINATPVNAPPVYAHPPNSMKPFPTLEFIPWN
ncbi:13386_t:CDS:2, partial [Acaulospora colombiana]